MSKITAEQARQMGRDKVPLRLSYHGLTLSLRDLDSSGGSTLFVELEGARNGITYATALPDHRPGVVDGRLQIGQFGEAFFRFYAKDGPLISAWLDGYYADAAQGDPR